MIKEKNSKTKIYAFIEEDALVYKDYFQAKNLEFIPTKNNLKKDILKEILLTKTKLKLSKIVYLSANILPFGNINKIFELDDAFFEDVETETMLFVSKKLITNESLSNLYEKISIAKSL